MASSRPQPTEQIVLEALAQGPRTIVELTMATRCHHATLSNLCKEMWDHGKLGRRLLSRREGRVYHLITGLSQTDK